MGWFKTPKQKFIVVMLLLLTMISGVFTGVAAMAGTEVLKHTYSEVDFEKEGLSADKVKSFTLESSSLCKIEIKSSTVNQSWVWATVRILDDKDRAVKDYSFNLSSYSGYEGGESWSENDSDDYKMIRLPAGTYKVMLSGEDAKASDANARFAASGYATIEHAETVEVRVSKGEWMSRYFLALLIAFASLTGIYIWWRHSKSQEESDYNEDGIYNG